MILVSTIHKPSNRFKETKLDDINFTVIENDNVVVILKSGELFGTKLTSFENESHRLELAKLHRFDVTYDDAVMGNYELVEVPEDVYKDYLEFSQSK